MGYGIVATKNNQAANNSSVSTWTDTMANNGCSGGSSVARTNANEPIVKKNPEAMSKPKVAASDKIGKRGVAAQKG